MPRFHRDRGRVIVTGATATVAGLAIGVAFALAHGDVARTGRSVDAGRDDERRAALLAPFRHFAEPADALPDSAIAAIETSADKQPGEDPGRSRIVRPAPGKTAFLWPMAEGLCYGSPGPSGCFPLELLEKRGAVLGSRFGYTSAGDLTYAHIFGIAADGVSEVRISLDTGRTVSVPVYENSLWAEFSTIPVSASWSYENTTHTQDKLVLKP
jgi:hypothetical protein